MVGSWLVACGRAGYRRGGESLPASERAAALWRLDGHGWHLLAFEGVRGRDANFAPDSPDLAPVAAALAELAPLPAPPEYGCPPPGTGGATTVPMATGSCSPVPGCCTPTQPQRTSSWKTADGPAWSTGRGLQLARPGSTRRCGECGWSPPAGTPRAGVAVGGPGARLERGRPDGRGGSCAGRGTTLARPRRRTGDHGRLDRPVRRRMGHLHRHPQQHLIGTDPPTGYSACGLSHVLVALYAGRGSGSTSGLCRYFGGSRASILCDGWGPHRGRSAARCRGSDRSRDTHGDGGPPLRKVSGRVGSMSRLRTEIREGALLLPANSDESSGGRQACAT